MVKPGCGDGCYTGEGEHLIAVLINADNVFNGEAELYVVTLNGVIYVVIGNTDSLHYGCIVDNRCTSAALNTAEDVELVVNYITGVSCNVNIGVSAVLVPGALVLCVVENILVLDELIEEVDVCIVHCDVKVEVRAGCRNVLCSYKNYTIIVCCVLNTVNGESSLSLCQLVNVGAGFSLTVGSGCCDGSINDNDLVLLCLCLGSATLTGCVFDCGVAGYCLVATLFGLSDGARAYYCEEAEHVGIFELCTVELELYVVTNVGLLNEYVNHTFGKYCFSFVVDLDGIKAALCFTGDSGLNELCGIACKAIDEVCAVYAVPSGCISKADDSLVLDYVKSVYVVSICCHVEVECVLGSVGVLACMCAIYGKVILCCPREAVCICIVHYAVNSESFLACVESVGVSVVLCQLGACTGSGSGTLNNEEGGVSLIKCACCAVGSGVNTCGSSCGIIPSGCDCGKSCKGDHLVAVSVLTQNFLEGDRELNVVAVICVLYVESVNACALSATVNVALCVHATLNTRINTELGGICLTFFTGKAETEVNAVEVVLGCVIIAPEDLLFLEELIEYVNVCIVSGHEYVEVRAACGHGDLSNEIYALVVSSLFKQTVNGNSYVGLVNLVYKVTLFAEIVFPCRLVGTC